MIKATFFFVNGNDMQNRMIYANIIFSYFLDIRLNFYSYNKIIYSSRKSPR